MNDNIRICRMSDYDRDVRLEVAKVFVDAYYRELSYFTKDKEILARAFKDSFCKEVTYLAEMNGEIVGMLGCSNNKMRTLHIYKEPFRKNFGVIAGNFTYCFTNKEFNTPLSYLDDTGYIECIATMEKARRRGIATALIKHAMNNLPYQKLILEVTDANESACRLYKKLHFSEFSRKREKLSRIKGFKERIYMMWTRQANA